MGIGVSVFLIAVGAVLAFAVHVTVQGLDLDTVGLILMVVGAIGLFSSLVIFGGPNSWGARRRTVVRDDIADPIAGRRVVREDYVEH